MGQVMTYMVHAFAWKSREMPIDLFKKRLSGKYLAVKLAGCGIDGIELAVG